MNQIEPVTDEQLDKYFPGGIYESEFLTRYGAARMYARIKADAEKLAEYAGIVQRLEEEAELDGLRRTVAEHAGRLSDHHGRLNELQMDVRNISGVCDGFSADIKALENTALPEPAVPVSVLREIQRKAARLSGRHWEFVPIVMAALGTAIAAAEKGVE